MAGVFEGIVYAAILMVFPSVVTLTWTNPPDLDLREIHMVGQEIGSPDTLAFPVYYGRKDLGLESEDHVLVPGMPDSMWVALPCRGSAHDWTFWLYAADTAGNFSVKSNITSWRQEPDDW